MSDALRRGLGRRGRLGGQPLTVNGANGRLSRMSLRSLGPATNRLLVEAVAVEGLAVLGFVYLGRYKPCSATGH